MDDDEEEEEGEEVDESPELCEYVLLEPLELSLPLSDDSSSSAR